MQKVDQSKEVIYSTGKCKQSIVLNIHSFIAADAHGKRFHQIWPLNMLGVVSSAQLMKANKPHPGQSVMREVLIQRELLQSYDLHQTSAYQFTRCSGTNSSKFDSYYKSAPYNFDCFADFRYTSK